METIASDHTFKSYLFFWGGQLISILGSSIIQFVIIFWIADITRSSIIVSIVYFLGSLPMVLIPPIIGVYIDRWNRKIVIAIADSLQAFTTFLIILFFISGIANIWLVISMNFLRGIFQAIHYPTVNSIIPIMIPRKYLSRMNAVNYLFTGIINVIGPIIGAILLAFFLIDQILWVDIFTFFIAIVPLIFITIPSISSSSEPNEKVSYIKEFKSGIRVLKSVKSFLILIIFISVINLLNMPFTTQISLFVLEDHSGNELDLALVSALLQAGIVIGAIIAFTKKHWKHKELIILWSVFIGISGYSITSLAPTGNFLLMGVGALIHASMIPIANTMFLTILQTKIPPESQGKVFSIVISIAAAITPLGMIISGPLAELFGIRLLFIIVLFLQFVSIVVTWFFTNLKNIIHSESEEDSIKKEEEVSLRPEQIEF
ncbi:MAG: MFS transporter [Candidatus Odinarchaeota archaeon]